MLRVETNERRGSTGTPHHALKGAVSYCYASAEKKIYIYLCINRAKSTPGVGSREPPTGGSRSEKIYRFFIRSFFFIHFRTTRIHRRSRRCSNLNATRRPQAAIRERDFTFSTYDTSKRKQLPPFYLGSLGDHREERHLSRDLDCRIFNVSNIVSKIWFDIRP